MKGLARRKERRCKKTKEEYRKRTVSYTHLDVYKRQGDGRLPLIYDWRAPVSSLFYDFDRGPASYEAPGGVVCGEICGKWQYKIRHGKMVYGFESDTKIDDEILKQELGNNGDVKLKNIVRTIQKAQNKIISNTRDEILVIQGAAGSGKTSIALHRIAYLLYNDREKLTSSNILILSPNGVFADYISHILPELGEEDVDKRQVLVYGIPEVRLPKEKVVKKEIEKVKELGVKFETNVVIGKSTTIDQLMEEEGFEAVFIGSGDGLPMFMGIPGENANGVFSATEYLLSLIHI